MAHSHEKAASVYDFLYVDAKRIGILLSQFGTDGVMTELTRATEASSETGGGFDVKLAKWDTKDGEKDGLTRRFDPQWLIPLLFLREADKMIVRSIAEARIGQFVLASGALSISDLAMLHQMWDIPILQKAMAKGINNDAASVPTLVPRHNRRTNARGGRGEPENPALAEVRGIVDIIKVLPHGVFANFAEQSGKAIWCALRGEGLVVSSSDLMLNHGAIISGEWNVVGVLDALPDSTIEAVPSFLGSPVTDVMQMLGPLARTLLGRPSVAYGMTPLLIFREVK